MRDEHNGRKACLCDSSVRKNISGPIEGRCYHLSFTGEREKEAREDEDVVGEYLVGKSDHMV